MSYSPPLTPRSFLRSFLPASAVAAAMLLAPVAAAQTAPASSPAVSVPAEAGQASDWLYAGSDIPRDTAWQFGILPNGVRYAVRNNGVPPGQVSIRVRMDVGSMFETDAERGFAHLLEHLTFRGSEHIPDGETKRIWQRFGVTFGSDSNAQTTPTQTVYQLDLPSVTPANLDESMKLLAGMVREPRISEAAVTAERGVVLSELRESDGPQKRIADLTTAHLFAGQLLGDRSPIGTVASLGAARAGAVQAFHNRWYRPDRAVVVISGDGDPAEFARLIAKYYGDWQGDGPVPTPPDFGKPDPKAPVAKVIVEPNQPLALTLAMIRPWKKRIDTVENTRRLYLEFIAQALVNRRLENRARAGGSFLVATVEQQYVSRSADVTMTQIVPLSDWKAALADVRGVIADAVTTPPSQADIDREANEIQAFLLKELDNARNEPGARLADDMVRAVDIGETVASPQGQVDMFKAIRASATPQVMLKISKAIFSAPVTRVVLTTPTAIPGGDGALIAALAAPAKIQGDRLAATNVDFKQLPAIGKPGSIVSTAPLPGLRAERIEFANGVTALVSNNQVEPGKVRVKVRFGTGNRSVAADAPNLLWTGDYALVASGIGPWGQNEIDQLTNGRQIQMNFSVEDDAFELSAESKPADLADQMKLMAAKLAMPRWDAAPVERLRVGYLTGYDLNDATPNAVLDRNLQGWLTGDDARWAAPDKAAISALTPAAFRAFWEPRLASGPIEVQIFGDLSTVDYKQILANTLGALPPRKELAPPSGQQVAFAKHNTTPMIAYHKGEQGQAAAMTAWPTSGGLANPRDAHGLEILAAIFNDRLFDRLRAEQGASYGPSADSHWPTGFEGSGGYLVVGSLLAPKDVDRFYGIVREIAADLVANPVGADELARNAGPLREQIERASTGNVYWMFLLEGATRDPRVAAAALSIGRDMSSITPADIQRLARQYLVSERQWSVAILPKGMTLADAAALDKAAAQGGR
ncbi:MAG TPA: insulinase family protein [Sphingopyxis sp.]|uniref:M16 family metallopeptidase n=1 Tax=Sphingopyxis sp. TaxID=1908224 RepID=UPI002E2F7602|nr:insulinase family protein [Sphingopyxis sp.]HEX2814042.1 insulinase family protein [Sphingopyxis sp.]